MVAHIRKLLHDDSSKPYPLLSQPPSSLINGVPKENYNLSPFLIPLFVALGAAFLVVSYFTFVKRYYLSSNDRTRAVSQNLDHDDQDNFGHEHLGMVIDHPVWLINTIGLEQSVIDSISVLKYKKNEVFSEGIVCSICLSEFESGETLRLLPKCSHAFHMACIDTWLRSHKNCPTCRAEIVSESVVNTECSESESNSNNLMPTGETSDENLGDFGEVEGHQESSEVGSTEKRGTKVIIMEKITCLDTKNCDSRVFSDFVGYREKAEPGLEPVRRSTSMDPSSTSSIYHSVAYIHNPVVEGSIYMKRSTSSTN